MQNAELGVVPRLGQLPLLEALQVVVEGLLLDQLEGLELDELPEDVLVWLGLQEAAIFGVRGQFLATVLEMQEGVGGVLGEVQRL